MLALEEALSFLEAVPEAYARFDRELRLTFLNPAAERLLGSARTKLLGKTLIQIFPARNGFSFAQDLSLAMVDRTVVRLEHYSESVHGWYAVTAIPDADRGIIVRFSENGNRKDEELASQQTLVEQVLGQERLQVIAKNLPGFIYQFYAKDDGKWGVYFADKRASDVLGLDPEPLETLFERFAACIAPEDRDRFVSSIRQSTSRVEDWDYEGKFITPAGREIYIRGVSHAKRLEGETIYDGIILNVTEHKRAEDALRSSEELYRRLFEVESDAILLVDKESGEILAANPAAIRLYGYSSDELASMNRIDLSAQPQESARATEARQAFIPLRWHRKKDGTIFPVEISGCYFDLRGRSVYVSAIRDITSRRSMEEAIKKSEQKFSKAFHANPAAIAIVDLTERTYLDVNETFVELTGYRFDEVVGHHWSELQFWVNRDRMEAAVAQLERGGRLRDCDITYHRKNGDLGSGLLSAELFEIDGKRCAITATMDITERIRLELQLRQAQKLESVGRLAGGVAHDFNNLLTVINGYSDLLLKELDSEDSRRSQVSEIKKAGERAADLTGQLLAFSRKQVNAPRPLAINSVIQETERMLRRLIGEDIDLVTTLDPEIGLVLADPSQIHQIIMNLAVNARDAMPGGGRIEIGTKNVEVNESSIGANPNATPGTFLELSLGDTGIGMDERTLQNAFEPFFTTKEAGQGTGLGLSTVYGIVHQAGGWIDVSSAVGQGTSFRIYLPLIEACPFSPADVPAATKSLRGSETVLVVEDQDDVRKLTTTVLNSYGYFVLEAACGADAIASASEHSGKIHLLLTDIILPGMSGPDLSEVLRASRPELKVLFASGYTPDAIAHHAVLAEGAAYLAKPFSPNDLVAKVREVLAN